MAFVFSVKQNTKSLYESEDGEEGSIEDLRKKGESIKWSIKGVGKQTC